MIDLLTADEFRKLDADEQHGYLMTIAGILYHYRLLYLSVDLLPPDMQEQHVQNYNEMVDQYDKLAVIAEPEYDRVVKGRKANLN